MEYKIMKCVYVLKQIAVIVAIIALPSCLIAYTFRDSIDFAYRISFSVNNAWEVKKEKASDFGKTYKIHPRGSKRSIMLMSVVKTPERNVDLAFSRKQTEEQGKKLLASSVEKELNIRELKDNEDKNTIGYYYRLTDATPEQEGYLYAVQGILPKEKSFVTFTYLFNYESEKELQSIFDTLKSIQVYYDGSRSKIAHLFFKEGELPGTIVGKDLIAKSIQVQYFFLRPDTYSAVLPPLAEKDIQSLKSNNSNGSIMIFRYESEIESAKSFLTGLFYGNSGTPSPDHPEEFILKGDIMVIFCFEKESALGAEAKKRVLEKLK